jgi:hypothetical protein
MYDNGRGRWPKPTILFWCWDLELVSGIIPVPLPGNFIREVPAFNEFR